MGKYIVFTEIFQSKKPERWYYGIYAYEEANRIASALGQDYEEGIFHRACAVEDAEALEIKNLPQWIKQEV